MAKREAWIYRAAAATACCLLLWFAFTVGWMWAYRQIVQIAPEWLLQSTRGSSTLLGYVAWMAYVASIMAGFFFARPLVFSIWRVPLGTLQPSGLAHDYPFKRRPKTIEDMAQEDPNHPFDRYT